MLVLVKAFPKLQVGAQGGLSDDTGHLHARESRPKAATRLLCRADGGLEVFSRYRGSTWSFRFSVHKSTRSRAGARAALLSAACGRTSRALEPQDAAVGYLMHQMLLPVLSESRSQGSLTGFRVLYRQKLHSCHPRPASQQISNRSVVSSLSPSTLELHRQADRCRPLTPWTPSSRLAVISQHR